MTGNGLGATLVGFGLLFWIFAIVVGIAYLFLPFAIFGTKGVLRDILVELKTNNRLMREAEERAKAVDRAGPPTQPGR